MIKFGEVIGGESFRWDLLLQIPSSEDLSSSLSLLRPTMLGKPETEAFELEAAELPPLPVDEAGHVCVFMCHQHHCAIMASVG